MNRKIIVILVIAPIILGAWIASSLLAGDNNNSGNGSQNPDKQAPYSATVRGEFVCLPHKDTSGPITLECALGIKADDGAHYGLDMTHIGFSAIANLTTGARISATGIVVQIEENSAMQKYDIKGILQASALREL